jgi:hypothetical protein
MFLKVAISGLGTGYLSTAIANLTAPIEFRFLRERIPDLRQRLLSSSFAGRAIAVLDISMRDNPFSTKEPPLVKWEYRSAFHEPNLRAIRS